MKKRKTQHDVDHHKFCELVDYNPETGIFTLKRDYRGKPAGSEWGTTNLKFGKYNYLMGCNQGYSTSNQRWAVFYMTGQFPDSGMVVDHLDHNTKNNRWDNLEVVTHAENLRRTNAHTKSYTGFKGVICDNVQRDCQTTYHARFRQNGEYHRSESFETAVEAAWRYDHLVRTHSKDSIKFMNFPVLEDERKAI